ncbi:MAG: hypothetical protein ABI639_16855 [Thermoanaerobaculia bacterium]
MTASEHSRNPGLTTRGVLFLALLVPVWAFGTVRGARISAHIGQTPPLFARELTSFERLRSAFAGIDRGILLTDREGLPSAAQYFSAQYVLAPTVLSLALNVGELVGPAFGNGSMKVVCLFDDPATGDRAVETLRAEAARRSLPVRVQRFDQNLALVTIGAS